MKFNVGHFPVGTKFTVFSRYVLDSTETEQKILTVKAIECSGPCSYVLICEEKGSNNQHLFFHTTLVSSIVSRGKGPVKVEDHTCQDFWATNGFWYRMFYTYEGVRKPRSHYFVYNFESFLKEVSRKYSNNDTHVMWHSLKELLLANGIALKVKVSEGLDLGSAVLVHKKRLHKILPALLRSCTVSASFTRKEDRLTTYDEFKLKRKP